MSSKKGNKKTEKRAEDVLFYLSMIGRLLNDPTITFNGVPISDQMRYQALNSELLKLISAMSMTRDDFTNLIQEMDLSDERTPENRELTAILQAAQTAIISEWVGE